MARSQTKRPTWALPEGKGKELIGVLCLVGGLILLASLVSYQPLDPSLFHRTAEDANTRNWIGPFGAELAALAYGFLGLSALLAPVFLLVTAARNIRGMKVERVVGRGSGGVLLLAALPPLLQLILGTRTFRAESFDTGGAFGVFLGGLLEARFGLLGALLVAVGALLVGLALAVQSSLEEILRKLGRSLGVGFGTARLSLERRRERQERQRSRRKVVQKQLERARERQQEGALEGAVAAEPLRVIERRGPAAFSIRRVSGAVRPVDWTEAELAASSVQVSAEPSSFTAPASSSDREKSPARAKTRKKKPQQDLGFAGGSDPHVLPPLNLLNLEKDEASISEDDLVRLGEVIRARCAEFGVEGSVEAITPGPVLTVFEFQPAPGVKVSQIVSLQDDLALSLKAEAVRIDRIPGRSTLGIEVPNEDRTIIRLGGFLCEEEFKRSPSPLTMALGCTLHGESYYGDLATMPHLLVAGATGAGKSVGLQSMITSMLYKANRDEVQFIFIDPKRIELGVYADIPHLKAEVVVEPKKAANALRWAVAEMEKRYRLLAEVHVRSIDYYNRAILDPEVQKRLSLRGEDEEEEALADRDELKPLPYYVVVIDELADLMMVSSSEVEQSIARLAQMARAVGIHLIVATQRPSVDVLTGTIKANFPCRMAFATASRHDSRTILDQIGAEKLLGKGDMLFLPPGSSRPIRLHGAYVSEQETAALVRWLKRRGKPQLDPAVLEAPREERGASGEAADSQDELFDEAARLVVAEGHGSASFLQRRMRVGFSRAARLIDMLEHDGILGPPQGSKPRDVLVKADFFQEVDP